MSTNQEYWDACLIRCWRNFQTVQDAASMFKSICGEWPEKIEPRLLRMPAQHTPRGVGIRYFVAHFLPKINDFLWDKPPEKDVDLLRALKTSQLDTRATSYSTNADREKTNAIAQIKRSRVRMAGNTISRSIRNHDTDWHVTKGPSKRGRA